MLFQEGFEIVRPLQLQVILKWNCPLDQGNSKVPLYQDWRALIGRDFSVVPDSVFLFFENSQIFFGRFLNYSQIFNLFFLLMFCLQEDRLCFVVTLK